MLEYLLGRRRSHADHRHLAAIGIPYAKRGFDRLLIGGADDGWGIHCRDSAHRRVVYGERGRGGFRVRDLFHTDYQIRGLSSFAPVCGSIDSLSRKLLKAT